jgi:alpha-tubulin suppressor-like RCC1 family protein
MTITARNEFPAMRTTHKKTITRILAGLTILSFLAGCTLKSSSTETVTPSAAPNKSPATVIPARPTETAIVSGVLGEGTYLADNPGITYSGSDWTVTSDSAVTDVQNAMAMWQIKLTRPGALVLRFRTSADFGRLQIQFDAGLPETPIDLSAASLESSQYWVSRTLEAGEHTVFLTSLDAKSANLQQVGVAGVLTEETRLHDESDPGVNKFGIWTITDFTAIANNGTAITSRPDSGAIIVVFEQNSSKPVSVRLIATSIQGNAVIDLDGNAMDIPYISTAKPRTNIVGLSNVEPGRHVLKITGDGTKNIVRFDGFEFTRSVSHLAEEQSVSFEVSPTVSNIVISTDIPTIEPPSELPTVSPTVQPTSAPILELSTPSTLPMTIAPAIEQTSPPVDPPLVAPTLQEVGEPFMLSTLPPATEPTSIAPNGLIQPAISLGDAYACALSSSGAVKCWGSNLFGQLGDGSETESQSTPVEVAGLSSNVVSISTGPNHACALTSSGSVKCWGQNTNGGLGDKTTTDRRTPVDVVDLTNGSGVTAISAGLGHTCALLSGGTVKCWGRNESGQLGDNTTTDSSVPVEVAGLSSGVVAISAGNELTCALISGGSVKCWGSNTNGQIGDGTYENRHSPTDVIGLSSSVVAISAGWSSACAILSTGAVKCWGSYDGGESSDKTKNMSRTPVVIVGLAEGSGVTAISVGRSTCVLIQSGAVKCFGSNNFGQLGNGLKTESLMPVDVVGLAGGSDITVISAGGANACAMTSAGTIQCWGQNQMGALGNGTTTDSLVPVDVINPFQ